MADQNQGNENERKRNPLDNRGDQIGDPWDDAKTGGDEKNVGMAGDAGGAARGMGVGSTGVIGGSAEFLDGEETGEVGNKPPQTIAAEPQESR